MYRTIVLCAACIQSFFFFKEEEGIRDVAVTGVQTCALPICPARSYQSMLEVAHSHTAMMALVLLMLTHLLIFAPFSRPAKVAFITSAFVSGIVDEGAGWLVRFVDPSFAFLKVAGFVGLQASLLFLLGNLAIFLLKARAREKQLSRFTLGEETVEDVEEEEEQMP